MHTIDKKIEEFKVWYGNQLPFHDEAVRFFSELIATIPMVESITGRTKSLEECISKFKRKYLPLLRPDENHFEIRDYLTDLIGIRAVCFYSDDVYEIRRRLKKYFREIEITDKSILLERSDDKFGYKSLHLQLVLKNRLEDVAESNRFKNIHIELQIRTVVQDAWSVLDHKIKYKKSIPQNLKRRINRLSAIFEIADDEFLSIQKEISQQERKINHRLKKGGKIDNTKALDVFRFLFVALKFFPEYNFIEFKVDGFVQEILLQKEDFTEGELNEALRKNLSHVNAIEKQIKQTLNPYTKIRYCLYRSNVKDFERILSDHQQGIFQRLS